MLRHLMSRRVVLLLILHMCDYLILTVARPQILFLAPYVLSNTTAVAIHAAKRAYEAISRLPAFAHMTTSWPFLRVNLTSQVAE